MVRVGNLVCFISLVAPLLACSDGADDDKRVPEGSLADSAVDMAGSAANDDATQTGEGASMEVALGVLAMCDLSVASVESCGSETCFEVDFVAQGTCTVNCCVDGQCGRRRVPLPGNTLVGETACALPVAGDDRCPTYTLGLFSFPGCCVEATNRCGFVDNVLSMSCIPRRSLSAVVGMLPQVPGVPTPTIAADRDAGLPFALAVADDAGVDLEDPVNNPLLDVSCDGTPIESVASSGN